MPTKQTQLFEPVQLQCCITKQFVKPLQECTTTFDAIGLGQMYWWQCPVCQSWHGQYLPKNWEVERKVKRACLDLPSSHLTVVI